MSYLVRATVAGRAVAFGDDPSGEYDRGAWFEAATGRLDPFLTFAWISFEDDAYHPDPLGRPLAFLEAQEATDVQTYSRPGRDHVFDPSSPNPE